MKSFEEFRLQEQEQLDEVAPLVGGLAAGAKWGLGAWGTQKLLDLLGWGTKKVTDTAGNIIKTGVDQVGKTAKKAWDGGDTKISGVKGTDEKGLPSVN